MGGTDFDQLNAFVTDLTLEFTSVTSDSAPFEFWFGSLAAVVEVRKPPSLGWVAEHVTFLDTNLLWFEELTLQVQVPEPVFPGFPVTYNPRFWQAHFTRAGLLHRAGRLADCLAALDAAMRVGAHQSPDAWLMRGDAELQLGRWDDAIAGFGCRVYPSGKRSFILSYRDAAGKKKLYTLGPYGVLTVDKARELAIKRRGELVDGKDPLRDRKRERVQARSGRVAAGMQREQPAAMDACISDSQGLPGGDVCGGVLRLITSFLMSSRATKGRRRRGDGRGRARETVRSAAAP